MDNQNPTPAQPCPWCTGAEIDAANDTDLPDLLSRLGYGTEEHFPPSGKDWNEYLIMMGKNHRPRFPPGRR